MISTIEVMIALAVGIFFAVKGFSDNVALSVILMMMGLISLSLVCTTFYRARRAAQAAKA